MLKALFILEIFKHLSDFLVMYKKGLIRKLRLISRLMTSHTEQQIIAIYLLSNISKSQGNQAMKLGQLTEYKMRIIFLEK